MKAWTDWACSRVISPADVGDMPPGDLAYWMGKFVFEVRKQNGDEYPPKSLCAMVCCFKRSLWYQFNWRNIWTFTWIWIKRNRMKKKQCYGLVGNLVHMMALLLNTVYYYNCKIFGLRSYDEHRNLKRTMMKKVVFISNMLISETSRIGVELKHIKVDNKKLWISLLNNCRKSVIFSIAARWRFWIWQTASWKELIAVKQLALRVEKQAIQERSRVQPHSTTD